MIDDGEKELRKYFEWAVRKLNIDPMEFELGYYDYFSEFADDDDLEFEFKEDESVDEILKIELPLEQKKAPPILKYDADGFEVFKIKGAWLPYGDYEGWVEGNTAEEIVSNLHVIVIGKIIDEETRRNIHLLI